MAFASGGMHGLSFVKETTFGTTPETPSMKKFRHTSCSLGLSKESLQSNELRADAQISDFRHGNKNASGDIGFELSYGAFDDFLEAAMRGTWATNVLKAGTTIPSFTFERAFADIGQYEVITGAQIGSMSLDVATNAMVTGTFNIVGKNVTFSTTSLGVAADVATNAPLDGFSGTISEGGTTIALVTSVNLSLDNGMSPLFVLGSDTAAGISAGRINVTGTVSAYFQDMTLLNKFINETESSLQFTLGNGTSKSYVINLPRIKYSGGENSVSGEDPIQLSMPFQALLDATAATNIMITRVPGA